uniref:ST3 beta-galactoside alpha-2,3-sialyltransferase 7 n=1 Tax=Sinocyclocheilus rhinocerous TaxID=307959 RepID=A0A673G2E9_9TELE
MVTLKHLSVNDNDKGRVPLLPEASSLESPTTQHSRAESRQFFHSRWSVSFMRLIALLLSCYSAILVPVYLPAPEPTWTNDSSAETLALLNQSAALLSQSCRSGWSVEKVRTLPTPAGLLKIPVFLENGTGDWALPPPLGLQGSEEMVAQALKALPYTAVPTGPETCRRCVVVSSLTNTHGVNNAPVFGYERDAGSRTTIRLIYPDAWLTSVVTKEPLVSNNVIDSIPLQPENVRILNPEIMYRAGQVLQTYAEQQKKMVPTLGITAVVLALQVCDEVSLAGFGYDMQHPGALLHYYGSPRMDAMNTQVVHDVSAETILLRELVKSGAMRDLMGAL